MRVLVCGGRDYQNAAFVNWVLDKIHAKLGITIIIHGCAQGADSMAEKWAETKAGVTSYGVPADWKTYGMRAGPVRNGLMLSQGKPQLVVAFEGGAGTAHMVKISEERKVKVIQADKFKSEFDAIKPAHVPLRNTSVTTDISEKRSKDTKFFGKTSPKNGLKSSCNCDVPPWEHCEHTLGER